MKTLLLLRSEYRYLEPAEQRRLEETDQSPRRSLFGCTLNSTVLDKRYLLRASGRRRFLYSLLPVWLAQVMEGFLARNQYDAIICWDVRLGLMLALLLKLTGSRIPHMVMVSWISQPKKYLLLRFVHSHINRLFVWSSVQRDFMLDRLKIPPSKIVFCEGRVDHRFFRPIERETDMICSAGREMRDYVTLVRALRNTAIKCHIAAPMIPGRQDAWKVGLAQEKPWPPHVTVGEMGDADLRGLYARSRFVIIPLIPTDSDNGLTCILEAMAMGKAVICTKTPGQRDIIIDGVNGLLVPPFNPQALAGAIQYLLDNPDEAARMGKAGRALVERSNNLDLFMARVKDSVEEAVNGFQKKGPGATTKHKDEQPFRREQPTDFAEPPSRTPVYSLHRHFSVRPEREGGLGG